MDLAECGARVAELVDGLARLDATVSEMLVEWELEDEIALHGGDPTSLPLR